MNYEFLREILDFLPDATFAIGCDGVVIAWNKAIEEMTGAKAKDMLGKGDYEYAIPFYGERKPILVNIVFKSDKDIEKKYRFLRREKDLIIAETGEARVKGEKAFLWGKASVIKDKDGKVIGGIESIRNITHVKATEASLKESQKKLMKKTVALQQKAVDLKDILDQVELEKKKIKENVIGNVDNILMPLLKKMKLHGESKKYIKLLHSGLEDIASSFGRNIKDKRHKLSSREVEICGMIKNGLSGKEISRLLSISFLTVEMHRKNIRRKLGISHKKVNLKTFLEEL